MNHEHELLARVAAAPERARSSFSPLRDGHVLLRGSTTGPRTRVPETCRAAILHTRALSGKAWQCGQER
jgi:hypothetical protein